MISELDKECCDYIARCRDAIGPIVIPAVNRIRPLLELDGRFRIGIECSGAYAEPPICRAGIAAERLVFPINHVTISFGCVMTRFPGQTKASLTISVGWHRSFFQNHHAGFAVYESRLSRQVQTIEEAVRLIAQYLPVCEVQMRQAVNRGTLPGKLTHWWHQQIRGVPPAEIWPLRGGRVQGLPNVETFSAIHDIDRSPKLS
jgi:hypothetical protein